MTSSSRDACLLPVDSLLLEEFSRLLRPWLAGSGHLQPEISLNIDAASDTKTATPLVRLSDAGKNYGNIIALQGVTLDVGASEVTCVLGDNGAGKSTLIKIIAGLHQHTHGTYEVEGESVKFASPREALDRGIATVYQDLAVVPLMPVWRNFFLGNEVRKGPAMDIAGMRTMAKQELLDMGIDLRDVDQPIGTLSGGERQRVAIARALANEPRILLADEPTGNLDPATSAHVFDSLLELVRASGVAALIATHNLELTRYMDRVFTIKDGHLEATASV